MSIYFLVCYAAACVAVVGIVAVAARCFCDCKNRGDAAFVAYITSGALLSIPLWAMAVWASQPPIPLPLAILLLVVLLVLGTMLFSTMLFLAVEFGRWFIGMTPLVDTMKEGEACEF